MRQTAPGHGRHIPLPQAGAEEIQWWPGQREVREREVQWTCECKARVFRLMVGGGVAWIRRSRPDGPDEETVRMRRQDAEALWYRILTGQAR